MRKYALSAVLAVLMLSGGATAAAAADTDGYGPDTPPSPSLSGTMVAPSCEANVPWIDYSVVLAGTLVATVPLLLLFVVAGKQLVSGIMQGAVKA